MSDFNWLITCLIIACLLPYFAKAPLAWSMQQFGRLQDKGYDNQLPRIQQQALTGFGARCLAAHENSFEALLVFIPAVLLTIATEQVTTLSVTLAWIFILSRVSYLFCYWLNWDKLRSTVWAIGLIVSIAMMYLCLN